MSRPGFADKATPVVKLIELLDNELNIVVTLLPPDTGLPELTICPGLGEIDPEQVQATNSAELLAEALEQLTGVLAGISPRLISLFFIGRRTAMPQPEAHRRGRYSTAGCLLLAADAAIESGARPEHIFIIQLICFPHNLQDARPSVVAPVHEVESTLFSLLKW